MARDKVVLPTPTNRDASPSVTSAMQPSSFRESRGAPWRPTGMVTLGWLTISVPYAVARFWARYDCRTWLAVAQRLQHGNPRVHQRASGLVILLASPCIN